MRPFIILPLAALYSHTPSVYGINQAYADAITKAGGQPLFIGRPNREEVLMLLPHIGGIFLAGGHDVDPSEYKEEKNEHTCNIDKGRDTVELMLVRLAREQGIPLLGVCRGMQVMNVALGGSLWQNIKKEMPGGTMHDYHYDEGGVLLPRSRISHSVSVQNESTFSRIVGADTLAVNSLHHQGIKKLGDELVAGAICPDDGLVEGIELPKHPFFIGVQWHPEELKDDASQKILSAFIAACKKKQAP